MPSRDRLRLASRPGPLRAGPGSRIYYEGKKGECGECRRWRITPARETLASNGIHDTILAVGIAAIPILIFCVIVNRLRHPDRSFLAAMALSVLGFFLVPSVATGTAILWVYTGGADGHAVGVGVVLWLLGFWLFRQWLRSALRSARQARTVTPSRARNLAALQDENARLRAEAMNREGE